MKQTMVLTDNFCATLGLLTAETAGLVDPYSPSV